jgi:hypothetical protein
MSNERGERHSGPGETLPDADEEEEHSYELRDELPTARPSGRRFISADSEKWTIEQNLVREGRLGGEHNRSIPLRDHAEHGDNADRDELRRRLRLEGETEHPNKSRIAYLTLRLAGSDIDEVDAEELEGDK